MKLYATIHGKPHTRPAKKGADASLEIELTARGVRQARALYHDGLLSIHTRKKVYDIDCTDKGV